MQDAEVQEFARLERQIRVEVGDLLADLQQPDVLQPVVQVRSPRPAPCHVSYAMSAARVLGVSVPQRVHYGVYEGKDVHSG